MRSVRPSGKWAWDGLPGVLFMALRLPGARPTRRGWAGLAFVVLALVGLWLGIGLTIRANFRNVSDLALRETANLARILEAQIAGKIDAIDATLRFGQTLFARDPSRFSLGPWSIVGGEPEAITAVLDGHDAVVWSAGAGGGSAERTYAVDRDAAIKTIDAAQANGGKHVVLVSYFGAGPDHGVSPDSDFFAYADAKSAADAHLQASTTPWTLLRPSSLTDGPATGVSTSDDEAGEVSRATVAAVVAAAVAAPEAAAGKVITFNTGDDDVATVFA